MLKPRIGITRKSGAASPALEAAYQRYRACVQGDGGDAVELPARRNVPPLFVQENGIHGLVLTGRSDLSPVLYGEQNRISRNIDDERVGGIAV